MEPQWYYTQQGQQVGPIPESQMRALIQSGRVGPAEFIFKEGMADWAPASLFVQLAGPASPVIGAAPAMISTRPVVGGEVTIGNIFNQAMEVFKANWLNLSLGVLIVGAISFGIGFVSGIVGAVARDEHNVLGNIASFIINGPITLGVWVMVLNAVDGKAVSPADVLEGFKRFLPAFVLNLLLMVAVVLGLIALIIGALIAGILLSMSWGYLADQQCSPIDALKQSFECVKSNFLTVFVVLLLCIPVMIGGLLCFCIGVIPAAALCMLLQAVTFRLLNPKLTV